jgi:hypothetical protein
MDWLVSRLLNYTSSSVQCAERDGMNMQGKQETIRDAHNRKTQDRLTYLAFKHVLHKRRQVH